MTLEVISIETTAVETQHHTIIRWIDSHLRYTP